jgi:hypothetical protein
MPATGPTTRSAVITTCAFLLRMAGEQLTWQTSDYETLARTATIFTQTPPGRPMECLLPGWGTEVFGWSLREYVGTAQLVWASAFGCAGRFDLALFDTPDGQVIARDISRETVIRVLDAHFAISKDQFRIEGKKVTQRAGRDDRLRRFAYNLLRGPDPARAHRVRRRLPSPSPPAGLGKGHPAVRRDVPSAPCSIQTTSCAK